MPYKIRVHNKKSITDPIEFTYLSERLLDWYEENQKNIFWAVILVLVLGVGASIWWFIEKNAQKAALLIDYEASQSLQDAQLYAGDENASKEAYQTGISKYQELIYQYPRTHSAAVARYRIGNSYNAMGDPKQAIQAYQDFLNVYGKNHEISPLVLQRLGYAYLELENFPEAEKHFTEVTQLDLAINRDQALFELGGLFEKMGQKEKALSNYKKISNDFPTSPIASEALARLKVLEPEQKTQDTPSEGDGEKALVPSQNQPDASSPEAP